MNRDAPVGEIPDFLVDNPSTPPVTPVSQPQGPKMFSTSNSDSSPSNIQIPMEAMSTFSGQPEGSSVSSISPPVPTNKGHSSRVESHESSSSHHKHSKDKKRKKDKKKHKHKDKEKDRKKSKKHDKERKRKASPSSSVAKHPNPPTTSSTEEPQGVSENSAQGLSSGSCSSDESPTSSPKRAKGDEF